MKFNITKKAVVLFTYRKYEFLVEIINQINNYCPKKIYVVIDCPQENNKDIQRDNIIVENLITNYNYSSPIEVIKPEDNQGLNKIFTYSLNKIFEKEDSIIVLEDDTIPNQSFFKFCSYMLEKYKDNNEISHINGCNLNCCYEDSSYFYSKFSLPLWGWATWKTKWEGIIENQDTIIESNYRKLGDYINNFHITQGINSFLKNRFIWDLDFAISSTLNKNMTVVSGTNLITNNGYCSKASNTILKESKFRNLIVQEIDDLSKIELNPKIEEIYITYIADFFREFENFEEKKHMFLNSLKKSI